MAKFGIQAIDLNGTQYSGIRGYQLDFGKQVESEGSDGTVYETLHNILQAKPMADLTTLAAKTMLAALNGSTDLPMLALNGTTGLKMYGAKVASNSPAYASGSVHRMRNAISGLIYCSGLKWSFPGYLEMSLKAMFKSSAGGTDPVTTSLVALPTQPVPVEKLTLSTLTIGGSALTNVKSVDISIDPKFDYDYSTGLPFPIDISGAGVKGHLAVKMEVDADEMDVGEGTGACSAVFASVLANAAGIGATGLTATLNGAWGTEEGFGGQQGSGVGRRLVVRSVFASAVKPFTWATF